MRASKVQSVSSRIQHWAKGLSTSNLFGKWSQDTGGGEGEVRQRITEYRVWYHTDGHCGQLWLNSAGHSKNLDKTRTSELSCLKGEGAEVLIHQPPSLVGWNSSRGMEIPQLLPDTLAAPVVLFSLAARECSQTKGNAGVAVGSRLVRAEAVWGDVTRGWQCPRQIRLPD